MSKISGKVVVTGGSGFIGSHIVEELLNHDCDVVVIDDLSTGRKENIKPFLGKVEFLEGSITDLDLLKKLFKGVTYVFHQAAIPSVPRSIDDPVMTHDANVNGMLNVLVAARDNDVDRVVYASSSSVYGDSPKLPKEESMQYNPLSPYAAHKMVKEYYAKLFHTIYDLDTVGLRYFNVFGPRQDPHSPYAGVMPLFITKMQKGEAPTIFGDGETTRDFTYVSNVVHANLAAARAPKAAGKVYNVALGERISLNDMCAMLNKLLDTDLQPTYGDFREGDIKHSLADISRAKRDLGYKPEISFEEGLKKLLAHGVE